MINSSDMTPNMYVLPEREQQIQQMQNQKRAVIPKNLISISRQNIENMNRLMSDTRKSFDPSQRCNYINEFQKYMRVCEYCANIVYEGKLTGDGTTAKAVKLRSCIACPHCTRLYCSFECMHPKILVRNNDSIEPLTGLKSSLIYKMCKTYLDHMNKRMNEDYFFTSESEYDFDHIDKGMKKELGIDFDISYLKFSLANPDADSMSSMACMRNDVVKFVSSNFTDTMRYRNRYMTLLLQHDTEIISLIGTFCGCRRCLVNNGNNNGNGNGNGNTAIAETQNRVRLIQPEVN